MPHPFNAPGEPVSARQRIVVAKPNLMLLYGASCGITLIEM